MDEMLQEIIDSGNVMLLFEVADEVFGTEDLVNLTIPFWDEKDRELIIKKTYEAMQ